MIRRLAGVPRYVRPTSRPTSRPVFDVATLFDGDRLKGLSNRAFRLYVVGLHYSARFQTDGFVPELSVYRYRRCVAELLARRLWVVRDEGDGYLIPGLGPVGSRESKRSPPVASAPRATRSSSLYRSRMARASATRCLDRPRSSKVAGSPGSGPPTGSSGAEIVAAAGS